MSISINTMDLAKTNNQPPLRQNQKPNNPRITTPTLADGVSFTGKEKVAKSTFRKFQILSRLYGSKLRDKFLKSEKFGSVLELAQKNPILCQSLFSLALAGILRPLTIMSLPGKKNKDDKMYASGHSIASGVIGFGFAYLLTTPIKDALKKVTDFPENFYKPSEKDLSKAKFQLNYQAHRRNTMSFLLPSKSLAKSAKPILIPEKEMIKVANNLAIKSFARSILKNKNVSTMIKMAPDVVLAPFRAAITICAIPPILKYVFGMEKKSGGKNNNDPSRILQNYAAINFKSVDFHEKPVFQNFKGGGK